MGCNKNEFTRMDGWSNNDAHEWESVGCGKSIRPCRLELNKWNEKEINQNHNLPYLSGTKIF